jgi:hypothetical protein
MDDRRLEGVAPGAREFLSAGLASFDHACTHASSSRPDDAAQVILSLAHGVEMLCKGVLLHRGEKIHEKGNRTISLRDALDKIGQVRHAPSMLVLVDRRDAIQHAAAYMDPASIRDYVQMAREFVGDVLGTVGVSVDICPEQPSAPSVGQATVGELVEARLGHEVGQQRDASFGGGALAWAQGAGTLRIRILQDGVTSWLTPDDSFEYMPRTDGRYVAAYRQSGGIVVYDLAEGRREVVLETGGPGAVQDGLIAAQGVGVPDGLGGGITLLPADASHIETVSEGGDSPRLSADRVVWQEFREQEHLILSRAVRGGDVEVLVRGGQQPALDGNLLVWTSSGPRPSVFVRDLTSGDERTLSDAGIMPDVRGGLVAFLELRGDLFDLRVVSVSAADEIVRVRDVGFPIGRGPILTDAQVVWESRAGSVEHRLWHLALPRQIGAE